MRRRSGLTHVAFAFRRTFQRACAAIARRAPGETRGTATRRHRRSKRGPAPATRAGPRFSVRVSVRPPLAPLLRCDAVASGISVVSRSILATAVSAALVVSLAGAQAPDERPAGTRRMVARLAAIAGVDESAPVGAATAPFASNRAAYIAALQERLGNVSDPVLAYGIRFEIAQQQLADGLSSEALAALDALEKALPGVLARVPEAERPAEEAALYWAIGIAALRVGEQENCLLHHTARSCIFPIDPGGVHAEQRGARRAIDAFTRQLRLEPRNAGAAWLLNIAYMTVGEYPDGVPPALLIPPDVFRSEYDPGRFPDRAVDVGLDVLGLAGGSIAEDFDGDGLLDLMVSSAGLRDPLRLLRNDGTGRFVDDTERAGLTGLFGGLNIVHADYDNDGDADVLVLRGAWRGERGRHPNSLLRNSGDGTFEDVTEQAGLLSLHPTQTAAWADYDGDGFLDVFIGNEASEGGPPHPSELYRNNGDGTFTNLARPLGLASLGFVKGAAWGDLNNDGRPDLYVSRFGQPNLLFRNDGPGIGGIWRFTDVTAAAGVAEPIKSFPTWFFDYDNDGWLDIFAGTWDESRIDVVAANALGMPWPDGVPRLYRNRRDGTFEDVTADARLDRVLLAMGANYGDLDNDGFLDIYVGTGGPDFTTLMPNRMFRNAGNGRFQDVTTAGGFGHLQKGHGVSFADIDNDGDLDVHAVIGGWLRGDTYQNVLFENPGHGNHWIAIDLEGTRSNRMGIGARLKVRIRTPDGPRDIHAVASTGGSFGGSPARQHIGLGEAIAIESLEATWPTTGLVQQVGAPPLDGFIKVREGEPGWQTVVRRTIPLGGAAPR